MLNGDETTHQATMFASSLFQTLSEPEEEAIPLCDELLKVNKYEAVRGEVNCKS